MASISSTTSTSYNRITGLATGMDTDAMVKAALQPYQLKVDQAKQARDLQLFKQNLYRDTIKDLRSLFTKYTDISKPDSLLLTKNYGTSKFTSTNEGAITAEGLSNAVLGNYKVEVQKVATTAKLEIKDFSNLQGQKITIDISGKSVDIDLTNIEIGTSFTNDDMIKKLNGAMKAARVEGKFSKSDIAGSIILQSTNTGSNQNIEISSFSNKIAASTSAKYSDIEDKKINFIFNDKDGGNTQNLELNLDDIPEELAGDAKKYYILDKINVALATYGAGAKYEGEGEDTKLVVTSKTIEDGNTINLSIENGTSEEEIISTPGKDDSTSILVGNNGENAKVKITDTYGNVTQVKNEAGEFVDGFVEKEFNEFTIDGVKFKITDVTTSPVTIVGKTDTTELVDKLKAFVEDYNKIIGNITTKINEKKDYNYKPLTESQKADMTEEQIEKWESKVKQGLLKRDNDLTSITSQLRTAFYDSVSGTSLSIKTLGIDFSNDIEKAGQLVIDEDKLSKALAENSEDVVKLFTQSAPSGTTDKKDIYSNSGIFQRIKTILNDSVMTSSSTFLQRVGYEGTSTYTDNDITEDLLKRERQISLMESNLSDRETRLYQKFAALEKAMNNYNAQSSWLMQQFGGA